MRDPTNPSFVYQHFQRAIMHYRDACVCTELYEITGEARDSDGNSRQVRQMLEVR